MKTKCLISSVAVGALFATTASAASNYLTFEGDELQRYRPNHQGGINVFETFRLPAPEFDGLVVKVGGHFTQQFQALDHETDAIPAPDANSALTEIGAGFNLATANLTLDAQLADGIRMNLVTYLSSRHHSETWVKAGYVQIDRSPFQNDFLEALMENVSLRLGHMEINYGDMHFRRSDNAATIYNPFVGNLIMDAFTTEIGGEAYLYSGDYFGMIGITGGEIKGAINRPDDRAPSFYGKVGIDRQMNDMLRVRLTGSVYTTDKSLNNTLYSGDRAGSRYYDVLDLDFTSGRFNPGFRDKVTSYVINPFIKYGGLELFGNIEQASGRAANESSDRTWTQYAGSAVYRFFEDESVYAGIRLNRAEGELAGQTQDASIDRIQIGGGWFINKYMLLKAEYVIQEYNDFNDPSDTRNGGKFDGFMLEAALGF